MKDFTVNIEKLFLILGLFWGFLFLIINPPFQAPDEDSHLFKMWGFLQQSYNFKIYNGEKGQIIPESLIKITDEFVKYKYSNATKVTSKQLLNLCKLPLEKNKNKFYIHAPTGYTIISYTPAVFVLFILKKINCNPLIMIYILRFCCLLTYLALTYSAIKIMPHKKWLLCILALLPSHLYIAGAISTDCLVIGTSFLLIAYTFKLKLDPNIKKINTKNIFIWAGLYTLLCIYKYLYFPFILLYFLLPNEKFTSKKAYYISFIMITLINLAYIAVFLFSIFLLNAIPALAQISNPDWNKVNNINYIINNPILFVCRVICFSFANFSISLFFKIAQFGWAPSCLSIWASSLFYILIFSAGFYKNDANKTIKTKDIIIYLLVITSTYLITITSIFGLYNDFGWQARYGTPYLFLIFAILTNINFSYSNTKFLYLIILLSQIGYIHACTQLIGRYY